MEKRALGSQGFKVSALGLGCMSMSGAYGLGGRDESIATIHEALDSGIDLLDTGDFYGMGHNEMLIGEALRDRKRESVNIAVKFGALRDHHGAFLGIDCRPAALKNFICYSLQRLNTEYIDLYFPARVDKSVPIEETVGAISDLIKEGKIRYLGLSEASSETLRKAHKVHPVSALEIEYAIGTREIEDTVLPALRELGVGLLAYGVLSRGLLSGRINNDTQFDKKDFRTHSPRFQKENLQNNLMIVDRLLEFAKLKGCTVSQLCFAWVLAQGSDIVPLIGTKHRSYLRENLGALKIQLSVGDIETLESIVPRGILAGSRYPAAASSLLNS